MSMTIKTKISTAAAIALTATMFAGCASSSPNLDQNNSITSKTISKYVEAKEVDLKKEKSKPFFNIKTGDNFKTILDRLSAIDGTIYIIESGEDYSSKFSVAGIKDRQELSEYFEASGHKLEITQSGKRYANVKLTQKELDSEKTLKKMKVNINGAMPVSSIIDEIASSGGVVVSYEDKTAGDISSVIRNIDFSGSGYDALNQVVSKSGLSIDYKASEIKIAYYKSQVFDLDVFVRDRLLSNIISNIPSNHSTSSGNTGSTTGSSSSNTSASSSTSGGTQDLKTEYITQLVKELKASLDSSISQYGSYTFLPTTGQIAIRDKGENIKIAQKLISDFNSKFKDTVDMKLTFYKVSTEKGSKRGIDFTALKSNLDLFGAVGSLSVTGTNLISGAFPGGVATASNFGVSLTKGSSNVILNYLKEFGDAQVANTITFETQSNMPKTVKIANNYGYISSISSSTDSNGGITGNVNPSSVPDGTFFNVIAKPITNNMIAADIYATANTLSKFNSVTAFNNTVQTPDTAEQSVDGYHQLKNGVPSILVAYKLEESKKGGAGLPAEMFDSIGLKTDSNKDVYIVISLEANIR